MFDWFKILRARRHTERAKTVRIAVPDGVAEAVESFRSSGVTVKEFVSAFGPTKPEHECEICDAFSGLHRENHRLLQQQASVSDVFEHDNALSDMSVGTPLQSEK